MLPCSEKWDHYLTSTFYGLLSVFGVVGGREAALVLQVTHEKIIPAWQEKLPLRNLKAVSWPHVATDDPMMFFVRAALANSVLMSGKIWKIVFFPLCIPSWIWMRRVQEDGPGRDWWKPHSWGHSSGLLCAISALSQRSKRLCFILSNIHRCKCNCPFFGGPKVRGEGVYNGNHIQPRAKVMRQCQNNTGETPQMHCYISPWLNIRCDLEIIKGTFLLSLENVVLLKLECFLSRCCFLSSYEWKTKQNTHKKNPTKKTPSQNKTPNPKGTWPCKPLWIDPIGFSSCGTSESSPAAFRVPESMSHGL